MKPIKSECVYCAVNSDNEIQWVDGSSSHTKFYLTDRHLKNAVDYHNKYNPCDIWRIAKFELKEVDYESV